MRALKDNHFNNSFSHPHLVVAPHRRLARVVSLDQVREVSQVVQVVSLEVLEGALVAIPQCQWDLLLPLHPKCNNYPQAGHNKVLVV